MISNSLQYQAKKVISSSKSNAAVFVWWIRCTLFVWTLDTYNLTQWTLNSGVGIVKNKLAVILNE